MEGFVSSEKRSINYIKHLCRYSLNKLGFNVSDNYNETVKNKYKDFIQDYADLGQQVFEQMFPSQKWQSILLQEKSLDEMINQRNAIANNPKKQLLASLMDSQIEINKNLLQQAKN